MTNKREFCPECHVFLDDDRHCRICNHTLMDLDMDNDDIEDLLDLGVLDLLETGEYNLTSLGLTIIEEYMGKVNKDAEQG